MQSACRLLLTRWILLVDTAPEGTRSQRRLRPAAPPGCYPTAGFLGCPVQMTSGRGWLGTGGVDEQPFSRVGTLLEPVRQPTFAFRARCQLRNPVDLPSVGQSGRAIAFHSEPALGAPLARISPAHLMEAHICAIVSPCQPLTPPHQPTAEPEPCRTLSQ